MEGPDRLTGAIAERPPGEEEETGGEEETGEEEEEEEEGVLVVHTGRLSTFFCFILKSDPLYLNKCQRILKKKLLTDQIQSSDLFVHLCER